MDSVADVLRGEERARMLARTAADRVALALRLGERDLEAFRGGAGAGASRADARRELERRRQAGRRRSACIESIIECPYSDV